MTAAGSAESTESAGQAFFPELEGLRGVAAWGLVLYHTWVFSSGAALAWDLGPATVFLPALQSSVVLFFVLSGFLLYRPFAAALGTGGRLPSARAYFRNRALRILPAYWIVVLVSSAVLRADVVAVHSGGNVAGALASPGAVVRNLLLVQNYAPNSIYTGVLPAWSLCIEVAFYLVLPLIALATWRFAARRSFQHAAYLPPACLFLIAVLSRIVLASVTDSSHLLRPTWSAVAARSFPANADLFAFGMAAAVLFLHWQQNGVPHWARGPSAGRICAYVGLPLFVLGHYFVPRPVYEPLVAMFAALLILRTLARRSERRSLLASKLARLAGRSSYSVFLWHYPILTALATAGLLDQQHTAGAFLMNLGLAGPLVAAASAASYQLVELPALRLRSVFRHRPPTRVGTAAPDKVLVDGLDGRSVV